MSDPIPLVAMQHDPGLFINYVGDDPEYYPDCGPVVVKELQTARIAARDLDALEIGSAGRVSVNTNGAKALEISALGLADPATVDTTVVDTGSKKLKLSSTSGVVFDTDNVEFQASTEFRSTVSTPEPGLPTFHHVASPSSMIVGSGVLTGDDDIVSGAFLRTTARTFDLQTDSSAIRSESGGQSRIRYEALHSHEFFAGSDAASAEAGSGVIEILGDRVVIRKDVKIVGTFDAVSSDSASLRVEDQLIRLSHSSDPASAHRDELLEAGPTGLLIDTVPGSYQVDAEYMARFTDSDGDALFVDNDAETIDVSRARESGFFAKEVAYHLNGGMKSAGGLSAQSRLNEPYWNVSGGALHVSHNVPVGDGLAKTYSLVFRVADNGTMEMVRITRHLKWDVGEGKYVSDETRSDTSKVVVRYVEAPSTY